MLDIRKFAFIALSRAARLELLKFVSRLWVCKYSIEYLYRAYSTCTEIIYGLQGRQIQGSWLWFFRLF